jgi:hypothetical protein
MLDRLVVAALLFVSSVASAQFDVQTLRPLGYHPGPVAYYNAPYFANALYQGGTWLSFSGFEWGMPVDYTTAQFVNGYPQYLQPGERLRAFLYGLNTNYTWRPATWPSRTSLARGRIVLTWRGNADVRFVSGTFIAGESSGAATGALLDGRRVYLATEASQGSQWIEVHAIVTPVTEIRAWLAAPDAPSTSLEGQLFHPLLLQRIADADFGFIRFMDWGATNASPQQDWSDRRLPAHAFMTGIVNPRPPAPGHQGYRETGVAWEYMVALANQTGRHMWINVPHLATDDYITRLAKLIRFGSDGVNPYEAPQANALFAPLRADLRVYVEYSNEIWSNGSAFAQGEWAQSRANALGITSEQFNARRFCDTWRIFQEVFGGTDRLVRVAATFTANDTYTRALLQEIAAYGITLTPAVRPDVLAVTTYFGNGIQDFVDAQGFTAGRLYDDPYWTSAQFDIDRQIVFDEWKRRVLAGDAMSDGGPDATALGGGFSATLRTLPLETLGYTLPIVSYEGGPSLYTDYMDASAEDASGIPTDDGVTMFMEAMNRDPRIADVYRIHLELAKSKGLWTHTPYTDTTFWGKYGQFGHLETLDQSASASPKWALMLQHSHCYSGLRHPDRPLGGVPQFSTSATLPPGVVGLPYTTDIETNGGDGTRVASVIGSLIDNTLGITSAGARLTVAGTPSVSRRNYLFAYVYDGDGDPAWRIFTLDVYGGPGTLVQSDFRGASAFSLPHQGTFVLDSSVTWSGWAAGAGIVPQSGSDAIAFSVSGPASGDESLAQAIADDQYLMATVTPVSGPLDLRGAEIRFSIRRSNYFAPRVYAVFSNVGGFGEEDALHVTQAVDNGELAETEHVVTLPETAAYAAVAAPFEIRIVAAGARYDGHRTSLTAFKLTRRE